MHSPVLFNALKHHLGNAANKIVSFANAGAAGHAEFITQTKTIGASTLDLYTGATMPETITADIMRQLARKNLVDPKAYQQWLAGHPSHYRVLAIPDGSAWVLRLGNRPGRFVHIHPARQSQHTIRVGANSLKTAIGLVLWQRKNKQATHTLLAINHVRQSFLGLSPIKNLAPGGSLARIIELVRMRVYNTLTHPSAIQPGVKR